MELVNDLQDILNEHMVLKHKQEQQREYRRTYYREYYRKNREKVLASVKRSHEKHKEKRAEYNRERYQREKETIKAKAAEYRKRLKAKSLRNQQISMSTYFFHFLFFKNIDFLMRNYHSKIDFLLKFR